MVATIDDVRVAFIRRLEAERAPAFRPEIEGLRALAVLSVVAYDLFGLPRAGFVGVDVFLVISGFLITNSLLKEHRQTSWITVLDFYRRRAVRVLPLAVVVLGACWLASRLLLSAARAHKTLIDIYWIAGQVGNQHFSSISGGQFRPSKASSPVQHFWLLSVGAQFYLLWPVLLGVVLYATRQTSRRMILAISVIALLISLLGAAVETRLDTSAAYFLSSTRAWELGAGAVLALILSRPVRISIAWRGPAIAIGVLAVVVSVVAVNAGSSSYPAPAGLLPIVGTALVIVGGTGALPLTAWPLTRKITRSVGAASFSLYLWHWPVIVFVQTRLATSGIYYLLSASCLTGALTICSYHLIEKPTRDFHWHELRYAIRRSELANRVKALRRNGIPPSNQRLTLVVLALVVVAFASWQAKPASTVRSQSPADDTAISLTPTAQPTQVPTAVVPFGQVTPPSGLSTAISNAVIATSFPKLDPPLDALATARVQEWKPCGNVGAANIGDCTFPSTSSSGKVGSIVVIGDSIAITWLPAVRTLQAQGFAIYGLTYGDCPAADVETKPTAGAPAGFAAACDAHRRWAVSEVAAVHADIVVLANSVDTIDRLASGASGAAAAAEWQTGTARMIGDVKAAGAKRVVTISPPPEGLNLQACARAGQASPGVCLAQLSPKWIALADAERAASQAAGTVYIDDRLLFCTATNFCPSFVGNQPVHVDGLHLSETYSQTLGPILDPLIVG